MARSVASILVVLVLAPAVLFALPSGAADSAAALPSPSTLPGARAAMAAVTHGEHIYLFGGCRAASSACFDYELTSQILRFTPATGQVRVMNATLPSPAMHASAVSTGNAIYVFGGFTGGPSGSIPFTSVIMRYDPVSDTIAWAGNLPWARGHTSAVWDGSSAWIFGGRTGTAQSRMADIVRFDAATGLTSTVGHLPTARNSMGVAFDGKHAYVMGGVDNTGYLRDILRFNVTSRTTTTLTTQLPSAYAPGSGGAVWNGHQIFLVGGSTNVGLTHVVRFNTTSSTVAQMAASLPAGRISAPVALVNSTAYVFGGFDGSSYRSEIMRYSWEPGAPGGLAASRSGRVVNLTWSPPASNTYSLAPASYEVWRSADNGASTRVATVSLPQLIDEDVLGGVSYTYRVRASNANGTSPLSSSVTITLALPPTAPLNLTATLALAPVADASPRVALTRTDLAWEAPASDGGSPVLRYTVSRIEGQGEVDIAETSGLNFTDAECPLARACVYRVRAHNAVGASDPSADASAPGTVLAPRVDDDGVYNDADGSGARDVGESLPPL